MLVKKQVPANTAEILPFKTQVRKSVPLNNSQFNKNLEKEIDKLDNSTSSSNNITNKSNIKKSKKKIGKMPLSQVLALLNNSASVQKDNISLCEMNSGISGNKKFKPVGFKDFEILNSSEIQVLDHSSSAYIDSTLDADSLLASVAAQYGIDVDEIYQEASSALNDSAKAMSGKTKQDLKPDNYFTKLELDIIKNLNGELPALKDVRVNHLSQPIPKDKILDAILKGIDHNSLNDLISIEFRKGNLNNGKGSELSMGANVSKETLNLLGLINLVESGNTNLVQEQYDLAKIDESNIEKTSLLGSNLNAKNSENNEKNIPNFNISQEIQNQIAKTKIKDNNSNIQDNSGADFENYIESKEGMYRFNNNSSGSENHTGSRFLNDKDSSLNPKLFDKNISGVNNLLYYKELQLGNKESAKQIDLPEELKTPIQPNEFPGAAFRIITNLPDQSTAIARLVLKPETLGTIFVEISLKENKVKLKIDAESADAVKNIEGQIELLKQKLAEKNILTESVDVKLKEREEQEPNTGMNQPDGRKNSKGQNSNRKFMKDLQNIPVLSGSMELSTT